MSKFEALSHEQFLKDLYEKNEHYRNREFEVIGEYVAAKENILLKNKYGLLKCSPDNLLRRKINPSIRSAVNPTDYFKNWLLKVNESYKSGDFWILGEYSDMKVHIDCENKFGKCKILPDHLIQGKKPDIRSALNPTEYLKNQFCEVHGDKYKYNLITNYNTSKSKVKIICPLHGEFSKTSDKHLVGEGCRKCGYERVSEYQSKNPNGWSWKKWEQKAESSKNFDSFKVYIIRCWNDEEEFFKIGKTFKTIEGRYKGLKYQYEILQIFIGSAEEMHNLERDLKRKYKEYKYLPKIKFDGMHECFSEILQEML